MTAKPYPKYKDSEITWLDKVPEGWQITGLNHLFKDNKVRNVGNSENRILSLSYGNIILKSRDDNFGLLPESFESYQLVESGYIILRLTDLQNDKRSLRVGLAQQRGIITSAYVGLVGYPKVNSAYYYYLLHYLDLIKLFYSLGGGVRQSSGYNELRSLKLPLPPLPEQTQIAAYLDHKCALLETAIQKKALLIEKLKEQKQAIINRAVTKGINREVKMKPSGVEWLGEVPEHWEVKKLKYVIKGKLKYGANESGSPYREDWARYIRITDFGDDGNIRDKSMLSLPPEIASPYLLEEGDILFARSGATVGKTFQFKNFKGKACFAGYLIKAKPDSKKVLSDFLNYYTFSNVYESWKISIFNKATIENIGADKYSQLLIPCPPIEEQEGILLLIEKESAKITQTITRIEREIELLNEYKTSLIAEAVTGKIDVRP
ncbi:MAG: restriction endonuclease subunit S [Saprospiraceae bacterium]